MEGFKVNLIRSEEHFQSYCNKIFAGWDFCITNSSMANLKHSSLRYELRVSAAGASLPASLCLGRPVAEKLGVRGPGCIRCLASFPFVVSFQELFLREQLPGVDSLRPKLGAGELGLGRGVGTQQ